MAIVAALGTANSAHVACVPAGDVQGVGDPNDLIRVGNDEAKSQTIYSVVGEAQTGNSTDPPKYNAVVYVGFRTIIPGRPRNGAEGNYTKITFSMENLGNTLAVFSFTYYIFNGQGQEMKFASYWLRSPDTCDTSFRAVNISKIWVQTVPTLMS